MYRIIDYWVSLNRYKTRQLFYRMVYKLSPPKKVSSYKNYTNNSITEMEFKLSNFLVNNNIPNNKQKHIADTISLFNQDKINVLDQEYSLNSFFNNDIFKKNFPHKLKSYEVSYFQFCHDIAFGILNNQISHDQIIRFFNTVIEILTQSIKLNNKHPFWYSYSVSTRIINLSFLYITINQKNIIDKSKLDFLRGQLLLGSEILESNLEFDSDGNHLLKNYTALFIIYNLFGDTRKSLKYKKKIKILLSYQILPSGLYFEKSFDYHMLVLHDLYYTEIIYRQSNNYEAESGLVTELVNMYSFAEKFYKEKEKPLFHDCFEPEYFDHNELLEIIKNFLKNNHIKRLTNNSVAPYINHSGKNFSFIIDSSEISPSFCPAHSHDHCLHYELWYKGKKIITDSGNYNYTESKERKYFRSSSAHNISVPKNIDSQSVLLKSFRFGRTAKRKYIHIENNKNITGSVNGYYKGFKINSFQRNFSINDKYIVIHDQFFNQRAINFIHLHPKVEIIFSGNHNYQLKRGNLSFSIEFEGEISTHEIIKTPYADSFFNISNKNTIVFNYHNEMKYKITLS